MTTGTRTAHRPRAQASGIGARSAGPALLLVLLVVLATLALLALVATPDVGFA